MFKKSFFSILMSINPNFPIKSSKEIAKFMKVIERHSRLYSLSMWFIFTWRSNIDKKT